MTTAAPYQPTTTDRSHVIKGKDGGEIHIVGQAPVRDGAIRFYQVFVNCLIGKRRELGPLPLHEIPLVRLAQRAFGGDVEVCAAWVPKVQHAQGMTQEQMRREIDRLAGCEKNGVPHPGAYVIPHGNESKDLFPVVYGTGSAMDLIPKMIKQYKAWQGLCLLCQRERRAATAEEIEAIVQIANPQAAAGLDLIPGLDAPVEMPDVEVEPTLTSDDVDHGLVNHLVQQQVPDLVAIAFAQEVSKTAPGDTLSDAQWKTVFSKGPKKTDTTAKRKGLMDELAAFRGFSEPAANV
jgi:hypothetical protein